MRRFLLILAVVLFAMTAFAAIAPGLYRVNVNSTLNVRNAPGVGLKSDRCPMEISCR